jgi:regulator of protease activity HflC (stomatin/prohibitin superfamily)
MSQEKPRSVMGGGSVLLLLLGGIAVVIWMFVSAAQTQSVGMGVAGGVLVLTEIILLSGFFVVNPNEARVLQLFGNYAGTVRAHGLRWANPFVTKRAISLKALSFQSEHMKVNDSEGNPIEIAAIIVYRVVDTAKAAFDVDDVGRYVPMQAESALRNLAQHYPYDAHDTGGMSLRGNTQQIAEHLKSEVQTASMLAGVEVLDARISHLAYAPEIAHAMLQRQQASAIVAARNIIVDGAVGMVEMAIDRLKRDNVVELDNERKAQMISNLLVVLCGQREAQPIVNTGTIYQ